MNNKEILKRLKDLEAKQEATNGSCPNCGYCPHCGRGHYTRPYYPYPWGGPYWYYQGSGTIGYVNPTTSSGTLSTGTSITTGGTDVAFTYTSQGDPS